MFISRSFDLAHEIKIKGKNATLFCCRMILLHRPLLCYSFTCYTERKETKRKGNTVVVSSERREEGYFLEPNKTTRKIAWASANTFPRTVWLHDYCMCGVALHATLVA
jgi:hypothetical protein